VEEGEIRLIRKEENSTPGGGKGEIFECRSDPTAIRKWQREAIVGPACSLLHPFFPVSLPVSTLSATQKKEKEKKKRKNKKGIAK
jgi:hypothetical protein